MTALNKQALREAANAANIASWGKWESYKPHKGARGYEVKVGAKAVAQHCLKVDSTFIATANPSTALALLDELEAAEKRIAEQREYYEGVIADGSRRIAELEALTVCLPKLPVLGSNAEWYEGFAAGASGMRNECADAIRAAGIGVKGE